MDVHAEYYKSGPAEERISSMLLAGLRHGIVELFVHDASMVGEIYVRFALPVPRG